MQVVTQIHTAKISFTSDGLPYSDEFSDIYFEHDHNDSQSEQVFIAGNNIPQIWNGVAENQDNFVIAETGFGTGLNFFLTVIAFLKFKQATNNNLKLHYISTEKYPISHQDMQQALALWPEFGDIRDTFLAQYKIDQIKSPLMTFADGAVQLQIYFCDATDGFSSIDLHQDHNNKGFVDAFYLDGFAPSRNPDMWQKPLFEQLARIAKKGASLATFTVAGQVKRDLKSVGFKIQKQKHDGQKSETLTATYVGFREGKPLAGYKVRPKIIKPKHVTIVGGGVASACVALALVKRGIRVNVYCQDTDTAMGASSNAIGAIYPLLHKTEDTISTFYQKSFDYALGLYQELLADGYDFSHGFDGLIDVCYKEALVKRQQSFAKESPWPVDLIHAIDASEVNKIADVTVDHPGLYYPRAGWVCPPELVNAILNAAKDTGLCKIKTNLKVQSIKAYGNERWLLDTNKGQKQVQHLILCPGADGLTMDILNDLPLSQVRGQVTQMKTNDDIGPLKAVLCHKGYLTPKHKGQHCIGATFEKDTDDVIDRAEDDIYNLDMLNRCLGNIGQWQPKDISGAKARLRCCTPDHIPMVGNLPNIDAHKELYQHLSSDKNWFIADEAPVQKGLYVLTGLGARGLCSAPLLADVLAAQLCDEPYPVDEDMLFHLSPNRFIIRDIIRRKFL